MSTNSSPRNDNSHEDGHDPRPAKRKRVAVACQACKKRKSRCDGGTPVCAACAAQGSECSYPPPLSKVDLLREDVKSMLQTLEGRVGSIEKVLSALSPQSGTTLPGATITPASLDSASNAPIQDGSGNEVLVPESAFQFTNVSEDSADGIGIVPLSSRDDFAFFGPSSNIFFLRLVSRALGRYSTVVRPQTSNVTGHVLPPNGNQPKRTLEDPLDARPLGGTFALPGNARMRELISGFFSNAGHIHPYVHESRFLEAYEDFKKSGFRAVRRSWLALLYIVLSLAAMSWPNSGPTLAQHNADSEAWYQMASKLALKPVFFGTGMNLEVVQCLLYTVLYLQSTHSSNKPSYILALAIKMAYALGLHSPEASRTSDPIEAEMRKRTWYGLVLLDRTLSMTCGRPAEITDGSYALSEPLPFVDSAQGDCLWLEECAVGYFRATLGLYNNLHQIVTTLYGKNTGIRPNFTLEIIAKTYQLETDLSRWARDLEPRLAIMQPDEVSPEPSDYEKTLEFFLRRHRTVITLRYLNARIFVHRPVLEGLLEAVVKEQTDVHHLRLMRQSGTNSIKVIVSSAIQSIELIHRLIVGTTHGHHQLGAWWFSLYYSFHAALAILGTFMASQPRWECGEILNEDERDSASRALRLSLETMDGLDGPEGEGHPTVVRCRQYMRNLIRLAEPLQVLSPSSTAEPAVFPYQPVFNNVTAQSSGSGQQMPGMMDFNQLGPFPSDLDIQNFLFPIDMQGFEGHLVGTDQPFL